MATITDISGSSVTITDLGSVLSNDSNINVFEFGCLLLADTFPVIISTASTTTDSAGSSVSESDIAGSSGTVSDIVGSSSSVVDISGS